MTACRLIVVEDDSITKETFGGLMEAVVREGLFSITYCSTADEARAALSEGHFDVALLDADTGERTPSGPALAGRILAGEMIRNAQLTRRILWTGLADTQRDRLLTCLQPDAPLFEYLLDKGLHPNYTGNLKALRSRSRVNWDLKVQLPETIPLPRGVSKNELKPGKLRETLEAFLRRLFFTESHTSAAADQVVEGASATRLLRGRSGAAVFELAIHVEGLADTICIMKYDLADEIRREVAAYERYVRYMLQVNRRVELWGWVTDGRLGALIYSYAGGSALARYEPAYEVLGVPERAQQIAPIIRDLFNPQKQEWYAVERRREATDSRLVGWLLQHLDIHERIREVERGIMEIVERSGGRIARTGGFDGEHTRLSIGTKTGLFDPSVVLRRDRFEVPFYTSIGHGDLHLGNLFLVDAARWMLIDFERTGRVHCLNDFYSLEVSVRQRLSVPGDLERAYQDEMNLAKAWRPLAGASKSDLESMSEAVPPSLGPVGQLVWDLRRLALLNFVDTMSSDRWFKEYLVGYVVHSLFVASRPGVTQIEAEALLVGAIYWFQLLRERMYSIG